MAVVFREKIISFEDVFFIIIFLYFKGERDLFV